VAGNSNSSPESPPPTPLHHDLQTSRQITTRHPRDTISGRGELSCTGHARIARCASPTTVGDSPPSRATGQLTAPFQTPPS
jgi:hypothetical protein